MCTNAFFIIVFIDLPVKTNMYVMQDLSHLFTKERAEIKNVKIKTNLMFLQLRKRLGKRGYINQVTKYLQCINGIIKITSLNHM
jgi:hypothetical protein